MMQLKKYLPYLAAILAFVLVSVLYFSPVLDGKRLFQNDIKMYKGMSKEIVDHRESTGEEALWTNSMFGGMPAYQISVKHSKNLIRYVDKALRLGLPRPVDMVFLYMLGFFILLMCLKVDPWLALVGSIAFALSSYFFVIIEAGHNSKANAIAYMAPTLGAFYLLYRGKMLVGGALLALFMALELTMNHVQVTYYMGFILLFFGFAELVRSIREGQLTDMLKRSGIAVAAIALAAMCTSSNLLTTKEYGEYTTRGKTELTILPDGSSNDAIRTSGLDKEYVTDWSYGLEESLSLIIPNAKGGATGAIGAQNDALKGLSPQFREGIAGQNQYWGDQRFTSGPHYLGALVCLLFILAIAYSEKKAMWWMLAALPLVLLLPAITSPLLAVLIVLGYIVAGAFLNRDVLQYALFSAMLITLILSWGKNYMPLTEFFLDNVPGYNKFRAVTIILVIVELCIPLIGVLFLARLIQKREELRTNLKPFLIGSGALMLFLLAAAISPTGLLGQEMFSVAEKASFATQMETAPEQAGQMQLFIDALKDVRTSIFRADALRSLAFVFFGAVLIFAFLKTKMSKYLLLAGVGLLVLIDQVPIDKRYLNNEKQGGRYVSWTDKNSNQYPFAPTQADLAILQSEARGEVQVVIDASLAELTERKKKAKGLDKRTTDVERQLAQFTGLNRATDYRVFDLANPFNDGRTSYFHKSIGGYHGAKMKRYQELIEFHLTDARNNIIAALQEGASMDAINTALQKEGVLNMLNAKYIVYNQDAAPITNINALGNAWPVADLRLVKDANEEIMALGEVDPARTALVDERYASMIPGDLNNDPSGTVSLHNYAPNHLTYNSSLSGKSVVVFSEIFYGRDWQAYIDGQPVEHFRADYVLRGLVVPAGEHSIEFKVEARTFQMGSTLSLIGSILILLLVLGMGVKVWKDRSAQEVAPNANP